MKNNNSKEAKLIVNISDEITEITTFISHVSHKPPIISHNHKHPTTNYKLLTLSDQIARHGVQAVAESDQF
jgi:hypothetical protein